MTTESFSNLRRLGKDSLIYGLNGVANRSIGIILLPIYTRVFAPSEYGVIDLITTTIVVFSYLSALGLDLAMGRYYGDTADETERRLTTSTALVFLVAVLVITLTIVLVMSEHLAQLSARERDVMVGRMRASLAGRHAPASRAEEGRLEEQGHDADLGWIEVAEDTLRV